MKNYYSTPLCIDEHGMYVLRTCENGHFVSTNYVCNSLQMADYACMDGLHLARTPEGKAFCYAKSQEVMKFQESIACPYNNFDAIDRTEFFVFLSDQFPLWLQYHLEGNEVGFGDFISNNFLGTTLKPWLETDNNKNRCLSADKGKISGDCNQRRYHVCMYRAISLQKDKEDKAILEEADYCFQQSMYCRVSWKSSKSIICICPSSLQDCRRPAVYPTAYGNYALGLSFGEKGLKWSSEYEYVRNTLWSVRDLKIKSENDTYVVWSDYGWKLTDKVSGIMCEIHIPLESKTKLILTFDVSTRKPNLEVKSGKGVFVTTGIKPYGIMCYQDHGFHLTRYEADSLKSWFSGYWQCEAVRIFDTATKILSDQVYMAFSDYIYIIYLNEDKSFSNKDILISHFSKTLLPLLPKPMFHIVEYNKISVNSTSLGTTIDTVYRMEFPLVANVSLDYRDIYRTLKEDLNKDTWKLYAPRLYALHFCDDIKNNDSGHYLHWPAADVGNESLTKCYDKSGKQLGARCEGNLKRGAQFLFPHCELFANKSDEIAQLEQSDAPAVEILTNLTNILQDSYNFTTEDFKTTANILEKCQGESELDDVLNVVSTLMNKNSETLYESQVEGNVTDRVLYSLDVSLACMQLTASEEFKKRENIESLIFDYNLSKYSGTAYLNNGDVAVLHKKLHVKDILKINNFESAAFIKHADGSGISSITMFRSSILFNEKLNKSNDHDTFHRVYGVLLPENVTNIELILIFPRDETNKCAFWKYGNETHGEWVIHDTSYSVNNFIVCIFNHTTHYGYLLFPTNILDPIGDLILSTMTMIECLLSVFGLSVILITACAFPEWRRKNVRFLHYSLVLLLQTILLLINSYVQMADWLCATSGAALHFTVLSQFCWMVVIAVQKHSTLIKVYQKETSFWETRWAMLFTYLVPLVIVGISVSLKWHLYVESSYNGWNICYPHGKLLIFALIAPLVCMTLFNTIIFVWVLFALNGTNQSHFSSAGDASGVYGWLQKNVHKICAIALMVFTMGITWWMGFAALILENDILLYLFSITTALQGFLIFVFAVLGRKEVRRMIVRKCNSNSW